MQAVLIKLNSTPQVGALNSPLTITGLNFASSKSTLLPNYLNWDWIMKRNICWAKSNTNDVFTHYINCVRFFCSFVKKVCLYSPHMYA